MSRSSRRSFIALSAAATLGLLRPALAASARVSTDRKGVAIQGYDTRAYWTHGEARLGADGFTVQWRGVPWRFASTADADAFAATPASFAPQFGGFCTRAMSLKKVIDGDPEVWRIFEGRLFLFARPIGGTYFDKGEAAMIAKAQIHWDRLS